MRKTHHTPTGCSLAGFTIIITVAIATILSTPTTSSAVDVFTDPVGFYKIPISPGANFLSAPLHKIHTFRGVVSAVSSNTVTVTGNPNWTANQFGPQDGFDQYILLVRRDASAGPGAGIEGDWWPITSNTGNTVTLDTGGDNLTTLLAAGDHVEIRRLTSLKDLFGAGSSLILNKDSNGDPRESEEDVIRFLEGTSFSLKIFYHDGTLADEGYYIGDTFYGDGSTITVFPDQALMVFRKTGSTNVNVTSMGQVQVTRLTHYLAPGANPFGTGFPANAPLGASNLKESGWISDSNGDPRTTEEDILRTGTGTSFGDLIFHHDGTLADAGWYVGENLDNNFPLQPGKGYWVFRKLGSGLLRWRQTVPFAP